MIALIISSIKAIEWMTLNVHGSLNLRSYILDLFILEKIAILPMMTWHSNSEIVNFNKRKSAYLNSWARLLLCYNLTHIIHEKEWEGMQISIKCCCTQHTVHTSTHKAIPAILYDRSFPQSWKKSKFFQMSELSSSFPNLIWVHSSLSLTSFLVGYTRIFFTCAPTRGRPTPVSTSQLGCSRGSIHQIRTPIYGHFTSLPPCKMISKAVR